MKFIIPVQPRTKKNGMQVGTNRYTGKTYVSQSDTYKQFESDCLRLLASQIRGVKTIGHGICLKVLFFRSDKRRVDLVGLLQAIQDILVKAEILKDDNSKIVTNVDGSRVLYDKENPRIEIYILDKNNDL